MKGIKPFRLSFLTRPFQVGARHRLGVAILGFFPLDERGAGLLPDADMWKLAGEHLAQDAYLDSGIPKSRSEVLVVGQAHAPGGRPVTTCPVRVTLGAIDASLYVIGDRRWERGVPTAPAPFTAMELGWHRAFGGVGYEKNPLGRGFAPVTEEDGSTVHPLPNVELPGALVTSPKDRPEPAGFGPLDFTWPQRAAYRGTYDQKWLEDGFPGFARDLDWRMWNLARPEQQQEAPFRGDEAVSMHNLHPTRARFDARLPGVRARCFVVQRAGGAEPRFVEVETRLTTVWLFPALERGIVIFHGAHDVAEDDASDVECLLVAGERLGEPRPEEHYRAVFERRSVPENAAEALNDANLMPADMAGLADELARAAELLTPKGLAQEKQRKRAEREIAEKRAMVAELGLDPDAHGPQPLPPPEEIPPLQKMPEFIAKKRAEAEALKAEAEREREESSAEAERMFEAMGFDYDVIREEKATVPMGPPEFSALERRAFFRKLADEAAASGQPMDELEHYATSPELFAEWQELEKRMLDGYRLGAHLQGPAPAAAAERDAELRRVVVEAIAKKESLANRNLTGVDLSGLDLSGADLRGALMESASFAGARLERTRLDDCVLAHARFDGAELSGASFVGANLGSASFAEVRGGAPVDLRKANLWKASLAGASLTHANLEEASLWEADLSRADLSHATLSSASFYRTQLLGARFSGAVMRACIFLEVDVQEVDFGGACLDEAVFLSSRGDRARFVNARMTSLRLVHGCSFPEADFQGACLERANLRATVLARADFSGALLGKADLSESDLEGARFYRAVARDSLFLKARLKGAFMVSADLMGALLQKADLRGVDLRGSNLYGADFALVRSDAGTNVTDAIQHKVRTVPRRPA